MSANTPYPLGFGSEFYTNICCLRYALRVPPGLSQLICGDQQFIFNVANKFMLARLERPLVKLLEYDNLRRFRWILPTSPLTACTVLTDRRVVKEPVDLASRNSASGQNPISESNSYLSNLAP
jgi:hypothetical protein